MRIVSWTFNSLRLFIGSMLVARRLRSVIAAKWMEHWRHGKSARYVDSTRRRIDTNILPSLGDKLITEITALHLVSMVKGIQDRGARDIAKRTPEITGQIFRFAFAHGYAERNPDADMRGSRIAMWQSWPHVLSTCHTPCYAEGKVVL